jgi:S-adenosylmethionine/arginine decarboxylase-like enzyme
MIEILETKLVKISFKKFKPQGYTSSAIIEASDIVIHTYPEYSFLNIHVSTCSKNSNPIVLINFFNNIGDVIYKYNEYVLGGEKDG